MSRVGIVDIGDNIDGAVRALFDKTTPGKDLLKESGRVYLKPNGIDFKPYAFTDTRVVKALIEYFYDCGASEIFVIENSTQANMTRIVFKFTGYGDICKETGARAVYLDEEELVGVRLPHFEEGVSFPRLVVEELIERRTENTYVSLPKLKTHSMSTVTLGVKNQMAFPSHTDRGYQHNYNLHRYLADLYKVVRPDYTLIDGTHAVFNGHYPLETFLSQSIERLDVLIGGKDTLSVDVVGARVLGYRIDEVKHLAIVKGDGLGEGDIEKIEVLGNLSRFRKRYPCDILDKMPDDVRIVRGTEMLCPEGCDLNVRMVLQLLYFDHGGKGGFTIVMGKGFDREVLESIEGRVLIAGDCAIGETQEILESRLGRKNIFTSPTCNRLADTTSALCKLMGISPLELLPSRLAAAKDLILAKLKGSKALIPDLM
ncbi:DUF362 domain-containing protein [Candidatus Thorarchaeota archaeon]|nr:MAG: DUF362 domain-containing protein [Candidatus Thorarchaeota archaeon]